jgi:hypothetical protein
MGRPLRKGGDEEILSQLGWGRGREFSSLTFSWTRKRQAVTPPMPLCLGMKGGGSLLFVRLWFRLLFLLIIPCKYIAGAQNAWDMLSDEKSPKHITTGMLSDEKSLKHITTGSSGINNILGGGGDSLQISY